MLAPGGRLAIATWMCAGGPVGAAFGMQMLVATRAGDAHSHGDYRIALTDAGYVEPPLAVILARRSPSS